MAVFTAQSHNNATFTATSKGTSNTLATAGLYYGFGCFTYSGGQVLSTALPAFTAQTKS